MSFRVVRMVVKYMDNTIERGTVRSSHRNAVTLMLRLLCGANLLLGKIIALGYLRYGLSTNFQYGKR